MGARLLWEQERCCFYRLRLGVFDPEVPDLNMKVVESWLLILG